MVTRDDNNMLTVAEVADLLHVHPNTLRRWSEEGIIETYQINARGDRRYKQKDINEFLSRFNPYKNNEKHN